MRYNYDNARYDCEYDCYFKDIEGYEGLYEVSDLGFVRNVRTGRILKPIIHKKSKKWQEKKGKNYFKYRVALWKNGKYKNMALHRLVALAFIKNPKNKPYVDHIDTDTSNNCVNNLRWSTPKENSNNELTKAKLRKKRKI